MAISEPCSFCGQAPEGRRLSWGANRDDTGRRISGARICEDCVERLSRLSFNRGRPTPVQRGTVLRWRDEKGHGIIRGPDGDAWVHFSAIESEGHKTLTAGEEVEFVADVRMHDSFTLQARWVRRAPTDRGDSD